MQASNYYFLWFLPHLRLHCCQWHHDLVASLTRIDKAKSASGDYFQRVCGYAMWFVCVFLGQVRSIPKAVRCLFLLFGTKGSAVSRERSKEHQRLAACIRKRGVMPIFLFLSIRSPTSRLALFSPRTSGAENITCEDSPLIFCKWYMVPRCHRHWRCLWSRQRMIWLLCKSGSRKTNINVEKITTHTGKGHIWQLNQPFQVQNRKRSRKLCGNLNLVLVTLLAPCVGSLYTTLCVRWDKEWHAPSSSYPEETAHFIEQLIVSH